MVPVDELVVEFGVAVHDPDRGIVGYKTQLALALAQPRYCLSKLHQNHVDFGDAFLRADRATF